MAVMLDKLKVPWLEAAIRWKINLTRGKYDFLTWSLLKQSKIGELCIKVLN